MGGEFTLGFICGEWLADDHDNIYYFSGWLASGFFVLGDLRDIAATLSRGDLVGTGLNLAGLIPGAGDAIKSSTIAITFVSKHPEMAIIIYKTFGGSFALVSARWSDEVISALRAKGISDEVIEVIAKSNGDLSKTINAVKRADGKVIWLEEGLNIAEASLIGRKASGWKHIEEKHINGPKGNDFEKVFGGTYKDSDKVKELIFDAVMNGQYLPEKRVYEYIEPVSEEKLRVAVGPNGYIVSAFPFVV